MHPFDDAIALEPGPDGRLVGRTDPRWMNMTGPFGGITAATLLNAVLRQPDLAGEPIAVTVHFSAPLSAGAFALDVRPVRQGRSVGHWLVELEQAGTVAAFATVVTSRRSPGLVHQPARMPAAPPPEAAAEFPAQQFTPWVARYRMRFVEGLLDRREVPAAELQPVRSVLWLEDVPARPLDAPGLLAMSDAFFGRSLHLRQAFAPFATITLTTYFHVGAADLAAGPPPVLGVAEADLFQDGLYNQRAQLWHPDGRLLASSVQMVTWRENG